MLLSLSLPPHLLRYAGDQTYFDEIKQFYYRDEFSHQVQEWNRQRTLAIERALSQFLYPQMAKELKSKLVAEAKESIVRVMSPLAFISCQLCQLVNIRDVIIIFQGMLIRVDSVSLLVMLSQTV